MSLFGYDFALNTLLAYAENEFPKLIPFLKRQEKIFSLSFV